MRLFTAAAAAVCLLLVLAAADPPAAAASAQPQAQPLPATITSATISQVLASGSTWQAATRIRNSTHSKPRSKSARVPADILMLTCPTEVVPLTDGDDLAAQYGIGGPNKTYLLQPGTYTLNANTISLATPDTITCFQGVDSARSAAGNPTVQILVGAVVGTDNRAFFVGGGAGLVLQNLLLDGQGSAAGVLVDGAVLQVTDVTMQGFKAENGGAILLVRSSTASITAAVFRDNTSGESGGAIVVFDSTARIIRTIFLKNSSDFGGALFARGEGGGKNLILRQVTFERNSAVASGGAIYVIAVQGTVALEGDNIFRANSAALGSGGGIFTVFNSVVVTGRLCGTSNTAKRQGGFAWADSSSLVFGEGSEVNLGLNEPNTVALLSGSTVQCGTSSTTWGDATIEDFSFNITGPACACNDQFVNNSATFQTCDSCDVGWDANRCACRQCQNLGQGCCQRDGTFSPEGTVCRRSAGLCDVEERCKAGGVCPEDSFVAAGTLCRSPRGACERPSVCSGKGPSCAKDYAINGKPCAFFKSDVKDYFWPTDIQSATARVADDQAHAPNLKERNTYSMGYQYGRETDDDLRHNHAGDTTGYYDRHSFVDSVDHTYKQHDSNWPECFGSCFAGKCTLEQERPGCCYPGSHGFYAASQQTAAVAAAFDTYEQQRPGQDLVCWRGAHDTPQIVQGQQ